MSDLFLLFSAKVHFTFWNGAMKTPAIHNSIKDMRTVLNRPCQPFLNPDNSPKGCSNLRSIFSRRMTEPWEEQRVLWHFNLSFSQHLPPAQGSLESHQSWNQPSFENQCSGVPGRCRMAYCSLESSIARELLPFSQYIMSSREKACSVRRVLLNSNNNQGQWFHTEAAYKGKTRWTSKKFGKTMKEKSVIWDIHSGSEKPGRIPGDLDARYCPQECAAHTQEKTEGPTAHCGRPFGSWAMGEWRVRHSDTQLVFWSCNLTPYLWRVLSEGWFNTFKDILAQSLADLSLDFGVTHQRIQTLQS